MTVAPVVANLGLLEALTLNPNPDEVSDSSPGLLPLAMAASPGHCGLC